MGSFPLLTCGEGELQKGLLLRRADLPDIVLEDAQSAGKTRFAQALEDLLRTVGMGVQPAHNLALIRVQAAAALELLRLDRQQAADSGAGARKASCKGEMAGACARSPMALLS
jgi:hypothetical protein